MTEALNSPLDPTTAQEGSAAVMSLPLHGLLALVLLSISFFFGDQFNGLELTQPGS